MSESAMIGGGWFWVALVAWLAIVWLLSENDYGFFGLVSTIGYCCLLQFVFHVNISGWVLANPWNLMLFLGSYFVTGSLWSFWRWFLFVRDKLEPYNKLKADWFVDKGLAPVETIPEELKEEWVKFIENDYTRRDLVRTPLVRQNKSKIMRWIGYWPLSVVTWALNDMVRRFVRMIYDSIHDWLQSIANRVFSKVKKDLPPDFNYR
jgi:hypothetical protein